MAEREWFAPPGDDSGQLVLHNTLADKKVAFYPDAGPDSKQLTWYGCGPTVYDVSHMGHARNYVTFDIIRRLLEDYFGYNILFVMNVTDVDDKIIKRARQNHLLDQYLASDPAAAQVLSEASAAAQAAVTSQESSLSKAKADAEAAAASGQSSRVVKDLSDKIKEEELKLVKTQETHAALAALPPSAPLSDVLAAGREVLATALDAKGAHTVTDAAVFRSHAAKYEASFMEDMRALGVRDPDVLTRVSEYMPEIVTYVQTIQDKGFAYESNGSVYFDTAAFRSPEGGHTYGKLAPHAVAGPAALAAESEADFETREKRSASDFALWKASKPGEPVWDSPWGKGRPGWHIECSAMASTIIGRRLDIHSGGEDLKFPHHDNELAQAEAWMHEAPAEAQSNCGGAVCSEDCRQWVNFFLHSGHLDIEGLKMSKSLKNFITIREALQEFTGRQLRLLFALQQWNSRITFNANSRQEMRQKEGLLNNFFQNVAVAVREVEQKEGHHDTKWLPRDAALNDVILAAQTGVHAALIDNLDTRTAIHVLCDLIGDVNKYLFSAEAGASPQPLLLNKAAAYVQKILAAMGIAPSATDALGLADGGEGGGSKDKAQLLDVISAFRDEVRELAKTSSNAAGDVLAACDRLRDERLADLGVRLEDRTGAASVWKLDDPKVLREEREAKKGAQREARCTKLRNLIDIKTKEVDKLAAVASTSLQSVMADKFSQWDAATGMPTHNKDGEALDEKALKKAGKEVEKVKKQRGPTEKKLAEDPQLLERLRGEQAALQAELEGLLL